jgi:hypothetical protein
MSFASFWGGGDLPALDRACLASFVRHGYEINVYSFDPVQFLPEGVRFVDANSIVERAAMTEFRYKGRPNLSHFSDYFRYEMFSKTRHTWIDTDMMLLKRIDLPMYANLFAKENPTSICGAIMRIDKNDQTLPLLLLHTKNLMNKELVWGATGPRLLTRVLGSRKIIGEAYEQKFFFPINHTEFYLPFLPELCEECNARCGDAFTLHLWNNIVVQFGFWKDLAPPEGSFLWKQLNRLNLLDFFRGCYPVDVMNNMVKNWQYRKTGCDIGIVQVAKQLLPSAVRTATPRVKALMQLRAT